MNFLHKKPSQPLTILLLIPVISFAQSQYLWWFSSFRGGEGARIFCFTTNPFFNKGENPEFAFSEKDTAVLFGSTPTSYILQLYSFVTSNSYLYVSLLLKVDYWMTEQYEEMGIHSVPVYKLQKRQEDLRAFLAHTVKIHDRKQALKRNQHLPDYMCFYKTWYFIAFTSHTVLITSLVRKFSPLSIFSEKDEVHLPTERGGNVYE